MSTNNNNAITHAALVAGDSDFLPALEVAKQVGISVWLFHHPSRGSYAQDLWEAADERRALDQDFLNPLRRERPA